MFLWPYSHKDQIFLTFWYKSKQDIFKEVKIQMKKKDFLKKPLSLFVIFIVTFIVEFNMSLLKCHIGDKFGHSSIMASVCSKKENPPIYCHQPLKNNIKQVKEPQGLQFIALAPTISKFLTFPPESVSFVSLLPSWRDQLLTQEFGKNFS